MDDLSIPTGQFNRSFAVPEISQLPHCLVENLEHGQFLDIHFVNDCAQGSFPVLWLTLSAS